MQLFIAESYVAESRVKVTGVGTSTGGIVGQLSAPLSDSYSGAEVSGKTNVGGIAGLFKDTAFSGQAGKSATVQHVYNTGSVTGDTNVGGIFGI